MTQPKVIVLDFDGVIVDSESGKREAWSTLFRTMHDPAGFSWSGVDTPPLIAQALEIWIDGEAKGSRYEIIEHIMDGARYPKTSERVRLYADAYTKLAEELIEQSGMADDTRDVLAALSARFPLYMNSGTPQEALTSIVEKLGIDAYFRKVLGKNPANRDTSKVDNLRIAAQDESVSPSEVLFIGDLESDYRAAQSFGCAFIRFSGSSYGKKKEWDSPTPHMITRLSEIAHFLS